MSNLEVFKDTDGVEITVGSRLVWESLPYRRQRTGIVFESSQTKGVFLVRISPGESPLLQQVLDKDNSSWVMVVPAYPKALIAKVA